MRTPQFVVKPYKPWRRWLILLSWLVVSGASIVWARWDIRHNIGQYAADNIDLVYQLQEAQSELELRREQYIQLVSEQQLNNETNTLLLNDNQVLQDKIYTLEKELSLFRHIIVPEESPDGLQLLEAMVSPTGTPTLFRYQYILIQSDVEHALLQGRVRLSIEGTSSSGEPTVLPAQAFMDTSEGIPFQFRYFQRFSGDIQLPAGFTPERLLFSIELTGQSSGTIQTFVPWINEGDDLHVET